LLVRLWTGPIKARRIKKSVPLGELVVSDSIILVHGQKMTVENHGGVGRYASELLTHLRMFETSGRLQGLKVNQFGFENDDPTSFGQAKSMGQKRTSNQIKATLKCFLKAALPEKMFLKSKLRYHALMHAARAISESSEPIHYLEFTNLVCESEKLLIHELTNFSCSESLVRLDRTSKMRLLATFHDVQDLYFPENFSDPALMSRRLHYSFYKERGDLFFAVSNFTKTSMIERLGIPENKILVTPLAADNINVSGFPPNLQNWAKEFGRFWIYPAKFWRHKNHNFLFAALSKRICELKHAGVKVLLTGGWTDSEFESIRKSVGDHGLQSTVLLLGFVSEQRLHVLISQAEYLIYPSLFEGFGIPILEAMVLGCPILTSDAGSIPEIAGSAGTYFDPLEIESLVDVIDSALTGGISREIQIQKGLEISKQFTWHNTVSKTLEGYRRLT